MRCCNTSITRTYRVIRRRSYEVRHGHAHFDRPTPESDINLRALSDGVGIGDDPYADVFVSVPEPTGEPS